MVTLLFAVLILGVIAWVISAVPIPDPFKTIAYAILVIILIILMFQAFGFDTGFPIR